MKLTGSLIKEQGITFAIALVKSSLLNKSTQDIELFRKNLVPIFGPVPIILAAQDSKGRFTYHGRPDIVKFLANTNPSRIPWKEYTIS